MPTKEITVQFRNDVKPGKKWGSIKTSENEIFGCPPNLLYQFNVGEVCTIQYTIGKGGFQGIDAKVAGKGPPLSPPPRQRTNPIDTENMFITALLKSFIEAGKIELSTTDIVAAIQDIQKAYRFTSTEKQTDDALDDQVPY